MATQRMYHPSINQYAQSRGPRTRPSPPHLDPPFTGRGQQRALARVSAKKGLPIDLQRLIWADVTGNYYSRGSVSNRAASALQAAWRRLMAIINWPFRWIMIPENHNGPITAIQQVGSYNPGFRAWMHYDDLLAAYERKRKYPSRNPDHYTGRNDMWALGADYIPEVD